MYIPVSNVAFHSTVLLRCRYNGEVVTLFAIYNFVENEDVRLQGYSAV